MRVKDNIPYFKERSFERIQEILDSTETFEEVETIPNSDKLTYNNGYYISCYSIFIDIRNSSTLPTKYKKPTLAKIYRAYISEVVALFQSSSKCKEINIVGDSVWAIYEYTVKADINEVFHGAYAANSIIATLNYKLCHKGIEPIRVGIGIDKGQALMIQAGFKGSGISDVIYMGGVVNSASKLCSKGGKNGISEIVVSSGVYDDFNGFTGVNNKPYQEMFTKNSLEDFYHGSIIRSDMNDWLIEQQKSKPCNR